MLAPIALFVYNRPNHTKRTVEALQKNLLAQESDLFIFSDGPAKEEVKAVREYIKTITGFKQIRIVERESNWGLAKSIIAGITEVVNKYGQVIVLEDDLVTSPYFLTYMNESLDLYQSEDGVISIHGYIYPVKSKLPETFFLKNPSCWGWATWQRGWDLFEPDGKKLLHELEKRNLIKEFDFGGSYSFSGMLKRQIAGLNNSWAIRWYASAFLKDKLTLYPGKSLIKNSGFDDSGTHSGKTNIYEPSMADHPIAVYKIPIKEDAVARQEITKYFRSLKSDRNKKLFLKVKGVLKKIITTIKVFLAKAKKINIVTPNPKIPNYYLFKDRFNAGSIIVDVGCGFDADFSVYMINKYGLKSVGLDPTLKHRESLAVLSQKMNGQFSHQLVAISATDGKITFNESVDNVSGSLLLEHRNIKNQTTNRYEVMSLSLASLPKYLGLKKIEYLKLDIEGAEYDLINQLTKEVTSKYDQIFIEFHHHALHQYSKKDTLDRVKRMNLLGFKAFTIDQRDFLFYR